MSLVPTMEYIEYFVNITCVNCNLYNIDYDRCINTFMFKIHSYDLNNPKARCGCKGDKNPPGRVHF